MDDVHPIFKIDPRVWYSDVNRKVCLRTLEGKSFEGWVYTVDPVTQNYILLAIDEASPDGRCTVTSASVVMSHAITHKTLLPDDCTEELRRCIDNFGQPPLAAGDTSLPAEVLLARRKAVVHWLARNRLPVTEPLSADGPLVVADVLTIMPPYTSECCQSSNPIILGRIQGLLKSMPVDASDTV